MILIAHRGNYNGRDIQRENTPNYIEEAIAAGYDCEIDVWYKDRSLFLGHDKPEHKIEAKWLTHPNIWAHAKNIDALHEMMEYAIHCFFHDKDQATLTSRGFIWTYPNCKLTTRSICVLPEFGSFDPISCGVCSDFAAKYREASSTLV